MARRTASRRTRRTSAERGHEPAEAANVTAARTVGSRAAARSVSCPPKEFPTRTTREGSIPGTGLEEAQGGEHVVELLGLEQGILQRLACLLPVHAFFEREPVLDERRCVRGGAVPAPEGVKEGVPSAGEEGRQLLRSLGDGHACRLPRVGAARSMAEQDRRKGPGPLWLPEEPVQLQGPAGELHGDRASCGCRDSGLATVLCEWSPIAVRGDDASGRQRGNGRESQEEACDHGTPSPRAVPPSPARADSWRRRRSECAPGRLLPVRAQALRRRARREGGMTRAFGGMTRAIGGAHEHASSPHSRRK